MDPPKSDVGAAEQGEPRDPFLSGAPRSGEVSTFALKLFGECFVLLASLVVFGSTLNFTASKGHCNGLCAYAILTSVLSVLVIMLLIFGHFLTWSSKMDRSNWFNSTTEKNAMKFLVLWWAAGVGGLSAVITKKLRKEPILTMEMAKNITRLLRNDTANMSVGDVAKMKSSAITFLKFGEERVPIRHASNIGIFFGWLAFFASIYTAFKAYHASKEEQRAFNYAQHYPYAATVEEEEHYANY